MFEECCLREEKGTQSVLSGLMLTVKMAKMNGLVVQQSVHFGSDRHCQEELGYNFALC